MVSIQTARRSLLVLLFAALALLAWVIRPLASALFLAAVLAGLLAPVQRKGARLLNGSRALSAALVVFATAILVVAPLTTLSLVIVKQGAESAVFISRTLERSGVEGLLRRLPAPVNRVVLDGIRRLPREPNENLDESVQRQLNAQSANAMAAVGTAISATGSLAFHTVLMMIALYFMLCHGGELIAWIDENAPLRRGQVKELLGEFQRVSSAVITSSLLTATAQAVAALVGYLLVGVPHPIFAASVTFFMAFIPAIGAGAACLGVSALVALAGHPYSGLFLAIWGLVIVGLADNVVRPLLIQDGAGMHGAIVFFSLIGGLEAFGALGLLIGPLAVALFLAILRMYRREVLVVRQTRPAHPQLVAK